MATWKQSGEYGSVKDMLLKKTGMTEKELLHGTHGPVKIAGMDLAYAVLRNCYEKKMPFYIIGDYDCDGITSTAILARVFRHWGAGVTTIIPKRFTDGYGISEKLVEGIKDSCIVTVDNGITGVDAIAYAKKNGNTVVVFDHHLPGAQLPAADVLVDPHIAPEQNDYVDFCGAGLAYVFAQTCFRKLTLHQDYLTELGILAAIGTIADVMPLTGPNRYMVKAMLNTINDPKWYDTIPHGLRAVLDLTDRPFTVESVSYTIAPVLNASGRMYNAGSTSTLKALLCDDLEEARKFAAKMQEINAKRKDVVARYAADAVAFCSKTQDVNPVTIYYSDDLPEGIVGIVAGKLAEELKKPAFVFCKAKDGTRKGSARSVKGFNLTPIIEGIQEIALRSGGHAGAAGVAVEPEKFPALCIRIQELAKEQKIGETEEDVLWYDMILREEDINSGAADALMEEIQRYAPYGEGCPQPVFMIPSFSVGCNDGPPYYLMGKEKEHIKLTHNGLNAVGFHLAGDYAQLKYPDPVALVGTLGTNTFRGFTSVQFMIKEMQKVQKEEKK